MTFQTGENPGRAEMEAQRFWIERAFEDAKSQVGMAEYQVRGWNAWYHHISDNLTVFFLKPEI